MPKYGPYIGFLVFVDHVSRLIVAFPIQAESVPEVKRCVDLWLIELDKLKPGSSAGVRVLQSNDGPGYQGDFGAWLSTYHHIKNIKTRPWRHRQSNSQTMQAMQSFTSYLRSTAIVIYGDRKRWPLALPAVVKITQASWQHRLQKSPLEAASCEDYPTKVVHL
jgi:hypothetical protein